MLAKFFMSVAFAVCLFVSSTCFAGLSDHPKIGVWEFKSIASESYDISIEDASMVSDYMLEELFATGRFDVMELEHLREVLAERRLANSCLDFSSTIDSVSAVEIGKLTGLEYLVYGSVTGLSSKESGVSANVIKHVGVANKQYIVSASITARIIDLKSGRIVLAAKGTDTSTSTKTEIAYRPGRRYYPLEGHFIRIGKDEVSQIQVHNALAKAVRDAVNGKDGILSRIDGKKEKKKGK